MGEQYDDEKAAEPESRESDRKVQRLKIGFIEKVLGGKRPRTSIEPLRIAVTLQGDLRSAAPVEAEEDQEVERREQKRFAMLYAAEVGTRYHRRRASFLMRFDTATNVVTLFAGASALGGVIGQLGTPWLIGLTATVSIIGITKIVTRVGAAANEHTSWFRRWATLSEQIELEEAPDTETLAQWARERGSIERECIVELRALCVDCENIAARVLGVPGRFRKIAWYQRPLLQLVTLQPSFKFVADPAVPPGPS